VSEKPLIAHVLYRLDTGGMEQVAISVINHTATRYRHAVIALVGIGAMRNRITDPAVPCLSLDKKPGKDWGCYFRLWKMLRRLKPDLVQTYNIGTLDVAPVAWLAGVPRVVHAEHGRDVADPDGTNRRYRAMRRWLEPFIARYVAVSTDLGKWLRESVGIAPAKVVCIPNGIDIERYAGAAGSRELRSLLGAFAPPGTLAVINVGRLDPVKDQAGLIAAFKLLCDSSPATAARFGLSSLAKGLVEMILRRRSRASACTVRYACWATARTCRKYWPSATCSRCRPLRKAFRLHCSKQWRPGCPLSPRALEAWAKWSSMA